jgi:hypothetical protein
MSAAFPSHLGASYLVGKVCNADTSDTDGGHVCRSRGELDVRKWILLKPQAPGLRYQTLITYALGLSTARSFYVCMLHPKYNLSKGPLPCKKS